MTELSTAVTIPQGGGTMDEFYAVEDAIASMTKEDLHDWYKREFWPVYLNFRNQHYSVCIVAMTKRGVSKAIQKLDSQYPSHKFIAFGNWDNGYAIYTTPPIEALVYSVLLERGDSVTLPLYRGKILKPE